MKGKEVDKIIVPLVNTTIGYIGETLRNLNGIKICDKETIPIVLNLAGKGSLDSIKYVHSKKEAFQQCKKRLSEFNIKVIIEDSTAQAAINVKDSYSRAAIVSKRASEIYGLNILENNIQDGKDNQTEFVVIKLRNI